MMPHRFAHDLARALAEQFGVEVPVVDAPLEGACIVAPPLRDIGDLYNGAAYAGEVELRNFERPDGGGPMQLTLDYSVHALSGQLDHWRLEASGFAGTGLEPLLQPRGAPDISANALLSVTIR